MSEVKEDMTAKIESMTGYEGDPVEDIIVTLAIVRQSIHASQLINAMNKVSAEVFQDAFKVFVGSGEEGSLTDLIGTVMSTPMTDQYPVIIKDDFDQHEFMKLSGEEMSAEMRKTSAKLFAMTSIFNWAIEDFSMPEGLVEALKQLEPDSDAS